MSMKNMVRVAAHIRRAILLRGSCAVKILLLAIALFGSGAANLNAQLQRTSHGFFARPIAAQNRILIGIGDVRFALSSESVDAFLATSNLQGQLSRGGSTLDLGSGISFSEFMSDASPVIPYLPAPYGSLGEVNIFGSAMFLRITPDIVSVRVSGGTSRQTLEISTAEAVEFGALLERAVQVLRGLNPGLEQQPERSSPPSPSRTMQTQERSAV